LQGRTRQTHGRACVADCGRCGMNGGIGQSISRLDGRAKVTGAARYTADMPVAGILYAVLVSSTIPKGTIATIDTAAAEASHGDMAAAESGAEVRVEGVYLTSDRHHNAMEPSATLAVWDDGHLMMRDTVQGVVAARALIAQALDLDPARVRVINEYVGGGF